jgi:hypothetical protein
VSSSPAGIDCGSTCSASFDYNTAVTLTAAAATGSTFTRWSGSGCSGTGSCTVTMNGTKSVTATFTSLPPPSVPTLVSPANKALVTDYTPRLDWNASSVPAETTFDYYQVQVATDVAFTLIVAEAEADGVANSEFTPASDLTSNTTHYWRVRSYNTYGKFSAWSLVRTFRTALPAPDSLNADGTFQNLRPVFTWNMPAYPPPEPTGYTVQVSKNSTFTLIVHTGTAATMSYIPTADLPRNLTLLYWRVRANGANGPSAWSNFGTFTTGNPPGIPALVLPANNALVTTLSPTLDWNQPNLMGGTFKSYRAQVATDATFTSVVRDSTITILANHSWIVDPALDPNTKYYWRVQACNIIDECSAWSLVRYFRTALPAPDSLNADGTFQNLRPVFTWNMPAYPPPAPTGYTVQVSKNSTFPLIVHTGTATTMSYIPTADLPRNLTLYWRVRANGANGPSAWSNFGTFTTGNPPGIPALVLPANNALVTTLSPTLDWNQPNLMGGTFKSYWAQVATDATFTSVVRDSTITIPANHSWIVDPALDPNTKYYWRVQACNIIDECSAWSLVRTFRTKLSQPAAISPIGGVTVGSLKPTFDWEDVTGAAGYTIQVSRNSTFTPLVVNATISTATSIYTPTTNLPAGITLYWRVRANGANGPSDWMVYATFVTP